MRILLGVFLMALPAFSQSAVSVKEDATVFTLSNGFLSAQVNKINRDGIQGFWVEKNLAFDAALMKAGDNTLKLTIPAGGPTSGIIYDYLRLELK